MIPVLMSLLLSLPQAPAPATGQTFDETIAPGANYDKANFRLWVPPGVEKVRAVVVLVPGSNGDGRPMAEDKFWQDFAVAQKVALVACQFTDKPHDQGFIEEYVNVSRGSGQALLDAIDRLARASAHSEVADSPLLLWGMSAGGEFNYEFVAWKPERVAAFIVNKGGIYYSALVPKAAQQVPGILFVGEKDLDSRTFTIKGLFGVNRRAGALWALAEEPGLGHVVGKSQELGALLFEEVLNAAPGSLNGKSGVVADIHTLALQPAASASTNNILTSWFVSERLANAWLAAIKK